ncbi:PH, RCC1 and FYVE domains-containing protein 1-like isoform X4 [Pyrus x bretschneideri]|uniref:PH, RCC1 and FYVE domains-containing protein 1-like isoform X4 n=1 Tax=Pyrus x bretschneideri TaxID=225117 RepID=UPI002030F81B|nr:PH, RCC1 and FYVE domains-containing protein 1-like isoform X4 [Pyrus x bretschneideri]
MAELVSYGNANRDIDQAIIALKEGAQLLKYGRKGKPKFCPFRLSTAVFQRYLRPEKEYLSFSLPYNNGTRSLDLICKDKVEAQVWIAGLKSLISSGRGGRSKIDGWSDGGLYLDVLQDGKHLTSNCPSDSSASGARDSGSPDLNSN